MADLQGSKPQRNSKKQATFRRMGAKSAALGRLEWERLADPGFQRGIVNLAGESNILERNAI